jgi:hypothetical protein
LLSIRVSKPCLFGSAWRLEGEVIEVPEEQAGAMIKAGVGELTTASKVVAAVRHAADTLAGKVD